MSHTVKIKALLNCPETLKAAVAALGGQWLGEGKHQMYEGAVVGYGFRLSGWKYPLVLQAGKLAYDDYNGRWGNPADLEKVQAAYELAAIEATAEALGWQCERQGEDLVVYHPVGGVLRCTSGTVDADGFVGGACEEAILALTPDVREWAPKPELLDQQQRVQQQ